MDLMHSVKNESLDVTSFRRINLLYVTAFSKLPIIENPPTRIYDNIDLSEE